jgi:hypothetical protein
MSPDQVFIATLLRALQQTRIQALVVGTVAAALQGAPILTRDIDFLIRDTRRNREKIAQLCAALGARATPFSELTTAIRLVGLETPVDLMFDTLPGVGRFESVRARSVRVPIGDREARVATLEDVIKSKETANRPKDRAQLPILRDTLRVKKALEEEGGS